MKKNLKQYGIADGLDHNVKALTRRETNAVAIGSMAAAATELRRRQAERDELNETVTQLVNDSRQLN